MLARNVPTSRRCLNHEKPSLGNVAALELNVATLVVPPLERRDVRSQSRVVSFSIICNVATLDPNVVTLDL